MTTLERLDFANITYAAAHDFARVDIDAFRDEAVGLAVEPPAWHLDDASLPPIAEYEQLLAKARHFEKRTNSLARHIYISLRRNWRMHAFLLRDETRRPVAGALWVLPAYQPRPPATPSLWHRLHTLLLRAWYFMRTLGAEDVFSESPVGRLFESAADEYDCTNTPARRAQLEGMPLSELRATTYPKAMSYFCDLFFVRPGQQGKRLGSKIMSECLSFIREQAVRPPNLPAGAPPKVALVAAPNAGGFYKKLGFEVGATAERSGNNGESLVFTYYFMNVD